MYAKRLVLMFLLCLLSMACVKQQTLPTVPPVTETPLVEPAPSHTEAEIPATDRPQIDWNTAFQRNDLPFGEVTADSVAFLKRNEDGSEAVITVRKTDVQDSLPKRLPRTHYFEQFMDPAVTEEVLPLLDYALFHDCRSLCVPTTALSQSQFEDSERFLSPTFFDTYSFRAQDIMKYVQPDGQTLLFLRIDFDNYDAVRDKYRRLDGLTGANAFVNNIPDGLDEREKMLRIYRWITETIQYYNKDGSSTAYYEKSWSLLFDTMIMHTTVDAGYAETLTIICNLAGIECFTVKSDSHFWNIAKIDGTYYHFDASCDRGLTPADYRYFGVSDATFRTFHGANAETSLPFYQEYGPSCTEDLFPVPLDAGTDETAPAYRIVTYYRFRNDRNANPLFLFYRMGYQYEEVGKQAPKNNRIGTRVELNALTQLLGSVMTERQLAQFTTGYFEQDTEGSGKLSYRVPPENPELSRLITLQDVGNCTWIARILQYRAPFDFSEAEETVTMIQIDGEWFVDRVE